MGIWFFSVHMMCWMSRCLKKIRARKAQEKQMKVDEEERRPFKRRKVDDERRKEVEAAAPAPKGRISLMEEFGVPEGKSSIFEWGGGVLWPQKNNKANFFTPAMIRNFGSFLG